MATNATAGHRALKSRCSPKQFTFRSAHTAHVRKPLAPVAALRPRDVKNVANSKSESSPMLGLATAAAVALLNLQGSALAADMTVPSQVSAPTATVAGLFGPKVTEDPYGADRKNAREPGRTKSPIPIISEQEAAITEAYPNPSTDPDERPPVLQAAEGDESGGPNAGQFSGVSEGNRQGLIDNYSPATGPPQFKTRDNAAPKAEPRAQATAQSVTGDVAVADEASFSPRRLLAGLFGSKVSEDPYGADKKNPAEPAQTKGPIPIPSEQEAVAPEAFPNPSVDPDERPPVLQAAEGDEGRGRTAGQFQGLSQENKQSLIDNYSPATGPAEFKTSYGGATARPE